MSAPTVSPWLLRGFARYSRRYLARHFHGVRLARGGAAPDETWDGPLVIYCNHSSWWDPLVGLLLALELLPARRHFAPIEAAQLERYRFFARLGFFGVEAGTLTGARAFLETAGAILERTDSVLWITPQGRFGDPRERPPRLQAGLAHLARRGNACLLPLALEYPFWDERLPEALARFGQPLDAAAVSGRPASEITRILAARLGRAQDRLAADAQTRDRAAFDLLLSGRSGVGGVYDRLRAAAARLRGERFQREHGAPDPPREGLRAPAGPR